MLATRTVNHDTCNITSMPYVIETKRKPFCNELVDTNNLKDFLNMNSASSNLIRERDTVRGYIEKLGFRKNIKF